MDLSIFSLKLFSKIGNHLIFFVYGFVEVLGKCTKTTMALREEFFSLYSNPACLTLMSPFTFFTLMLAQLYSPHHLETKDTRNKKEGTNRLMLLQVTLNDLRLTM